MKRKTEKRPRYQFYRYRICRKKLEAVLKLALLVFKLLQAILSFWFPIHNA